MLYEFKFPDIGEGIHEGTLLEWKCRPGDSVDEGEVLGLVETDKVVTDIPSPRKGVIAELVLEEGETVEVGQVMVRIELGDTGGAKSDGSAAAADRGSVVGSLDEEVTLLPAPENRGIGEPDSRRVARRKALATPVARRLASKKGIDIGGVPGTGPGGRVLKADILKAAARDLESLDAERGGGSGTEDRENQKAADGVFHPLSTLRMALARNMEKSWKIPAAEIHDFTAVDELADLRRELNLSHSGGRRLSYLPFFIKIAALALGRIPVLNSLYFPDRQGYVACESINIGVAMDSEEGLVVPVVRNADKLSIEEIQGEVDRLQEAASNRSLELSEIRDGSFTVTNFGSVGGSYGRPLILPPQVAILGLGRIQSMPVAVGEEVKVGRVLPLSLVVDHRLVDGADAVRFLNFFMQSVSKPSTLVAVLR